MVNNIYASAVTFQVFRQIAPTGNDQHVTVLEMTKGTTEPEVQVIALRSDRELTAGTFTVGTALGEKTAQIAHNVRGDPAKRSQLHLTTGLSQ